jgi:hypothetical protein
MAKPVGTGVLFPKNAHDEFMTVTRTRYSSMVERLKRKKLPPLPFTLDEFRADILSVMGGKQDGAVVCRYCKMAFALDGIAVDHAKPLSRGGSAGLENIDYPCRADNYRKGAMTMQEYGSLLAFLETQHPLMRQDVLSRLEKAVQLASGAFANQGTIADLKKTGQWQAVQAARRAKKKAKESGLGAF